MNAMMLLVCLTGGATVGQDTEIISKAPRIPAAKHAAGELVRIDPRNRKVTRRKRSRARR